MVIARRILALTWLACLPALSSIPYKHARSYYESRVDLAEPEAYRIQKHLSEVEWHLRNHPPAGLSSAQAAARLALMDELRAYRMRGLFPQNLDRRDTLYPVFIDHRGIACAVGQLIIASGHRALADRISATRNYAYIEDLADPDQQSPALEALSLRDWARSHGLTLEECARIQPGYPASYSDVLELHLDSRDRVWILTGSEMGNIAQNRFTLSYRESGSWVSSFQPEAPRFFCTVGDRVLVGFPTGFSWDGGPTIESEIVGTGLRAGAASPDGKGFLVGGSKGLGRFVLEGSNPPLQVETLRAGADGFPSDTVTQLAWVKNRIWAGTPKSLATRTSPGGNWTVLPCSTLGGIHLGGLKAGPPGGITCAGMLQSITYRDMAGRFLNFSETGLMVLDEVGTLKQYTRKNSALPSDTLFFVAPTSDGSVWLACGQGVFKFTPPGTVSPFPHALPPNVNSMEVGIGNRLHFGTFAATMGGSFGKGVYRLDADSLAWLGHPTGSTSLSRIRRERAELVGGGSLRLHNVLGRRAGSRLHTAAGFYLLESGPVTVAPSLR